jgi:choline kinase
MTSNKAPKVRALIFAEGGSSGLRPLTDHLPTGLVPVGGTPILDRQIQLLLRNNIQDIVVIGGYRAAQVEQACRFYEGVHFRYNPHFSREEPHLAALAAAGPVEGKSLLLIPGDLVFDEELLSALLKGKSNSTAINTRGKSIGLYRLASESARTVVEAGDQAMSAGGSTRDLFGFLETSLTKVNEIPTREFAWARVTTMEDLAKALKAHRNSSAERVSGEAARVAATEAEEGKTRALEPLEASQNPTTAPSEEAETEDPVGGRSLLPRPLLRVLHR